MEVQDKIEKPLDVKVAVNLLWASLAIALIDVVICSLQLDFSELSKESETFILGFIVGFIWNSIFLYTRKNHSMAHLSQSRM